MVNLPLLALCVSAAVPAVEDGGASMFRYPDISNEEIVFAYANDLWRVPVEGGIALPLASPDGVEVIPRFSPDGSQVAFMGNYEGNRDLYVVPTRGGMPHRVTHHPGSERLSDWGPDGTLLFSGRNMGGVPRAEMVFSVDAEGGMPEALPMPYGANATIDRSGTWVAYTPNQRDGRTWKRYRGGMASDLWLLNLETGESRRVTDWEGTDTMPMWHGDQLFYLSDAGPEHRLNLWKYDVATGDASQLTDFADYDVKWPSIGPDDGRAAKIVFQMGSDLHVYDDANGRHEAVSIEVPGATASLRPNRVDASDYITEWSLSPNAKRAVVSARGDLWTLPAKNGSPRNMSRTSGFAERSPSWSPDGKWIAYFSDEPGEYELFVRRSDGKGEPRRLTDDLGTFKYSIWWAPDSSYLIYADKTGTAYRIDIEDGARTLIGKNEWSEFPEPSFSQDGRWIAWSAATGDSTMGRIHLHDFKTGETNIVTSGMFNDDSPAFDRDGDWLYFTSDRRFSPSYSTLDGTWIYDDSGVLVAVPLRDDVASPWLEESDEEAWTEDDEKDMKKMKGRKDKKSDDDAASEDDEEGDSDADAADDANDPVSGDWACIITSPREGMPNLDMTVSLSMAADGSVTGSVSSMMINGEVSGTFDADEMTLTLEVSVDGSGVVAAIEVTIDGDTFAGLAMPMMGNIPPTGITGTRMASNDDEEDQEAVEEEGDDTDSETDSKTDGDDAEAEVEEEDPFEDTLEIDLDGFEARAMMLPVRPGAFANLAVDNRGRLNYVRRGSNGGIKTFELDSKDPSEQSAGSGRAFQMTADGKKMLVPQGSGAVIRNAGSGGGDRVVTSPMYVMIEPRAEWRQLVTDAWRIQRDHFYDPGLHGVDWDAVLEAYLPLVDEANTREDVSYIIGEMISELNVGHAYYYGGDAESEPSMNVGLLGVDWMPVAGEGDVPDGYRISKVYGGAEWDVDARGPLQEPGLDLEEGDIVVAVNGMPMSLDTDPWRPFVGTAGSSVVLTVLERDADENDSEDADSEDMDSDVMETEGDDAEETETAEEDEKEVGATRDVVVRTIRSEADLRYRDWIEGRRAAVAEMSDGAVGYIYVPNTGRDGQSDLVRQFHGQSHMPALVIDERWNGGGQIPNRFIELLNRPVTNYWARRDTRDWRWPNGTHAGPKAMLINGNSGSGGDMFPWLFRHHELGPIIGTRTWGGLVGISGNPELIDGGYTAVPTFGFYENDGTWGIEGHGVDPDIEVIADPALMLDGGDPQLEKAVEVMLEALANGEGYQPVARPASPDRSGMGVTEEDK